MLFNYEGKSDWVGVYVIWNRMSNRCYVGKTSRSFRKRWSEHRKSLLNKDVKGRATNRYLKNDFWLWYELVDQHDFLEFHVLEAVEKASEEWLNEKEVEWIAAHKAFGRAVYNFTEGGEGQVFGFIHSTEAREKMMQAHSGKKQSPETIEKRRQAMTGEGNPNFGKKFSPEYRQKLSEAHKGIQAGESHPMYGKHHSETAKEKISASLRSKQLTGSRSHNSKRYENIKLVSPTGEVFTEIDCLTSFCVQHDLEKSNFCNVLNGKRPSHKGWVLG